MKKILLVLFVLVLAPPSIASAVESSGKPILVLESEADSGGGLAPKSWLFNDSFFVRSHICRTTSPLTILCGPDPLVNSGAAFNGVHRIFVPFNDNYTVYFFLTDPEGTVIKFAGGNFNLSANTYPNFFFTFTPTSDGLYQFFGLIIGNGTGGITFGPRYQVRIGGPGSGGCCP